MRTGEHETKIDLTKMCSENGDSIYLGPIWCCCEHGIELSSSGKEGQHVDELAAIDFPRITFVHIKLCKYVMLLK